MNEEMVEKGARDLIRIVKLMSPMKAITFSAYKNQVVKILSLETKTHRIAVIKKHGELPIFKPSLSATKEENNLVQLGYNCGRADMLKAGYVQEV